MISLDPSFLRGSYTPLVTPFRNGEVDYDKYAELVDFQIQHGSHGIVVCGTSGEPSTLTVSERSQLLEVAVDAAGGRIPVVAATGSQSQAETMALTMQAEQLGAAAVLVVTPYYSKPPQRGLVEYYCNLAGRIALPLLIYQIPERTAVSVEIHTLERIIDMAANVVGIKQAANDLGLVTQMLSRFGFDFRVFAGLEQLSFPMLALGASGIMNAVGNIAPRQVAELYEATSRGALERARQLHFELFELNQAVSFDTNPIPVKAMMKRIGLLAVNEHRLPMVPATTELAERLEGVLRRAALI